MEHVQSVAESPRIVISSAADVQIWKMLAKRAAGETALRVGVKAGGCSGYEYVFGWERAPKDTDLLFEGPGGAKVYVDPRSLRVLDGTTLDYDTSLLSRGFVFNNPNATSVCGCGASFSIEKSERQSNI
ncbi:MAG: iron-sulfur cluster assembly accessory protein [Acidobacteria bacterium]|nr:MAG: iron-sulfur cluster assembly accessory protein [Acidobacteriota bacterium]PYR25102.1 MAG: iron-sulfur cluster assembly accessory protein [Acidobacteriota bacterium]